MNDHVALELLDVQISSKCLLHCINFKNNAAVCQCCFQGLFLLDTTDSKIHHQLDYCSFSDGSVRSKPIYFYRQQYVDK